MEHAPKHTDTPTPQPGVAGRSRNPNLSTDTHTAHPSQEWRSRSRARTHAHTHPNTQARSGAVQAECAHNHTISSTPQPGVAGGSRNLKPGTHTYTAHPSRDWRATSAPGTQTHTHPNTQARSGGAQAKPAPSTHTHAAHPSQQWRGTSGARTKAHRHSNTPARSGGAQLKPEPKHTHAHCTPEPGVAGYKQSAHTHTHTPKHPSQEWRSTSGARTQTHNKLNTPARSGGGQPKPEARHTHPHGTP